MSELDQSHPVQIAGINIPPLIVRRASTTVELRDGQSFVIGGLLQNKSTTAQQQLPWLGDVPVLGALFRSAAYQKNETDLAIIVTPRLVRPARPGDAGQDAARQHAAAERRRLLPDGQGRDHAAREARLAVGHQRRFVGHILDMRKGGHQCRRRQELSRRKLLAGDRRCSVPLLGGCSDIYYDRRETISLGAGDAHGRPTGSP